MKLEDLRNGDVFISSKRKGLWINVKTIDGNKHLCLINVGNEIKKTSSLQKYAASGDSEIDYIILFNLIDLYLKSKEK